MSQFRASNLTSQIPIDAAIALEFLPKNRRFLLTLLSLWQPVGVVICTIIACVPALACASLMSQIRRHSAEQCGRDERGTH